MTGESTREPTRFVNLLRWVGAENIPPRGGYGLRAGETLEDVGRLARVAADAARAAQRDPTARTRFTAAELWEMDLPEPRSFFVIDATDQVVHLFWAGHRYEIDLDEIRAPIDLIGWIVHIGQKQWPLATSERIAALIDQIAWLKGWNIHTGQVLSNRETSADEERAKLTRELRYSVLKRDGHRCRSCGSGPEHGAVLHIDHVDPIARGGRTEFRNLQTLCASCNYGKGVS